MPSAASEERVMELGRVGVYRQTREFTPDIAVALEGLGYGAIWMGGSRLEDFGLIAQMLDATQSITVASSIVNMWRSTPAEAAVAYQRIAAEHGERFVLGVGIGHAEHNAGFARPYATMVAYLDELDAHGVPAAVRGLAALGPRVLALAGERTGVAIPYLTTPEHTRGARSILGDRALLAPAQKVLLCEDPELARSIARPSVTAPYSALGNYRASLLRQGFTEQDLADASDGLIDGLIGHGSAAAVAGRLRDHLSAGADHVSVDVIALPGEDFLAGYEVVADQLGLSA
jgi:probable F420-dependent oxidoreductase